MKKFIYFNISLFSLIIVIGLCLGVGSVIVSKSRHNSNNNLFFDISNGGIVKLNQSVSSGGVYTITASVEPVDIMIEDVAWTISWKESASQDVNDYVKLTTSSDLLSVEVEYIKNFDTQIIVECLLTYGGGSKERASCTIDCYKRISSFEGYGAYNGISCTVDSNNNIVVPSNFEQYDFDDITFDSHGINYELFGSVDVEVTNTYQLALSEELLLLLDESNLDYNSSSINPKSIDGLTIYEVFVYYFFDSYDSNRTQYLNVLAQTDCWFTITLNVVGTYNNTEVWNEDLSVDICGFNTSYYKQIQSFTLSKTMIIF